MPLLKGRRGPGDILGRARYAARITGCSVRQAQRWITQFLKNGARSHGHCLLNEFQDALLLAKVIDSTRSSMCVRPCDVIVFASDIYNLKNFAGVDVAQSTRKTKSPAFDYHWVERWLRRHSEYLKYGKARAITAKRANVSTGSSSHLIRSWACDLERDLKIFKIFSEEQVINADESSVVEFDDLYKVISTLGLPGYVRFSRGGTKASVLPFVTAAGKVLIVFIISKCSFDTRYQPSDPEGYYHLPGLPKESTDEYWDTEWVLSETGYLNQKLWTECVIPKLLKRLKKYRTEIKLPLLLIKDNLGAHCTAAADETLVTIGCHVKNLPPNTTHRTQPLDQHVFAEFKKLVKLRSAELRQANFALGLPLDNSRYRVHRVALAGALTPQIIMASFRATCLWPFNPKNFVNFVKNSDDPCPKTQKYATAMAAVRELERQRVNRSTRISRSFVVHNLNNGGV